MTMDPKPQNSVLKGTSTFPAVFPMWAGRLLERTWTFHGLQDFALSVARELQHQASWIVKFDPCFVKSAARTFKVLTFWQYHDKIHLRIPCSNPPRVSKSLKP